MSRKSYDDEAIPVEADRDKARPGGEQTVVVRDGHVARHGVLRSVVSKVGGHPLSIDRPAMLGKLRAAARARVAVVGLAGASSEDPSELGDIRRLRESGFRVLACAEGADAWPLATRCELLVAGVEQFLDSADPLFPIHLEELLASLLERERKQALETGHVDALMEELGIVGKSHALREVFLTILKVRAFSDLPVLILGETGTGKELLARALHRLDPRRGGGPFTAINCAAISASLAESELFGHRRGAFTGAERGRPGLVRAAHGGVLFLDEVGELEQGLQGKLLRVIQEGRVLAVGEDREEKVDVRIIAATNQDLQDLVSRGRFRRDLFHRLNVLSIRVPALHERLEDLPLLVRHFMAKHQQLRPSLGSEVAPSFLEALERLSFPGNVRELENLLRTILARKEDDFPLSLRDLPTDVLRQLVRPPPGFPAAAPGPNPGEGRRLLDLFDEHAWNLARCLEGCERLLLAESLRRTGGNRTGAARLLGVSPRTVYNKLRKHRLSA